MNTLSLRQAPGHVLWVLCFMLAVCCLCSNASRAEDLLIICTDSDEAALQPLIDHKNNTGISTLLLTLSEVRAGYHSLDGSMARDDPERIKFAIYDHYDRFGISYVLLVGDCNRMPVRYTRGQLDDYTPGDTYVYAEMIWEPSDLYYADILDSSGDFHDWDRDNNGRYGEVYRDAINHDEIDIHPDVAVGRIPTNGPRETSMYVAKVIRYEYSTPTASPNWFYNLTFSAYNLSGWYPTGTMETIADNLDHFPISVLRLYHSGLYGPLPPPASPPTPTPTPALPATDGDPVPASLNNAMNTGTGFLFHSGHGGLTRWHGGGGVHCYSSADMSGLTNEYRLPIIFVDSCETARFCPYIPYNDYRTRAGSTQTAVGRGDIDDWEPPEPDCIQPAIYNQDCIGEDLVAGTETGAIAYWGCVNTGESTSLVLAREFFSSFNVGDTLGDMWIDAIEAYYSEYDLGRYDKDFSGNAKDAWKLHHPSRFILFGDPSLRVGGGYLDIPPDLVPPETTDNVASEWYADFTLRLDPTDNASGVYYTKYRVNGGPWLDGNSYSFWFATGIQNYLVEYYSVDFFLNQETPKTAEFNIDRIAPEEPNIALSGDPPAVEGEDFGGPVTATIDCTDAGSGMNYVDLIIEKWNSAYGGFWEYHRYDAVSAPFPTDYIINTPGRYRVTAYGVDNVGREGPPMDVEFSTVWVDDNTWFRDLAHILRGPWDLYLPPKLELPFTPTEVAFYGRPYTQPEWTFLGADTNPDGGWGFMWDTTKFTDDLYDIEARVRRVDKAGAAPLEEIIPMMTCAVRNLSDQSYEFTLDEYPRTVDRGEAVFHTITFTNDTGRNLTDAEILFDLGKGTNYDPSNLSIADNGKLDEQYVIHWSLGSLKDSEKRTVTFGCSAKGSVPSGTQVYGQAYFRCDEIPILTSNDPNTKELPGNPTSFLVWATGGSISGKVLGEYKLNELQGASVTLSGYPSTTAGSGGSFSFTDLDPGVYTLSAEFPPEYRDDEVTVSVDGNSVTQNLYLPQNDVIAPEILLDGIFDDYIANSEDPTGTATDNEPGSGVAIVEGALQRLGDNLYWDGQEWNKPPTFFEADGTDKWTLSLPGSPYDQGYAYVLRMRAADKEKNSAEAYFPSAPPTPTGLEAEYLGDGVVRFSWEPIPGADYTIEVTSDPTGPADIYEYVEKEVFQTSLSPGFHYWKVYGRIGDVWSEPAGYLILFAPGETDAITIY